MPKSTAIRLTASCRRRPRRPRRGPVGGAHPAAALRDEVLADATRLVEALAGRSPAE